VFNLGVEPPYIPHPIRKRAWHRALKRAALWLILPYCQASNVKEKEFRGNRFSEVFFDGNCPDEFGYITWPFRTGLKPVEKKD